MELTVDGRKVYAATGGKLFDGSKPAVIFIREPPWTRYLVPSGPVTMAPISSAPRADGGAPGVPGADAGLPAGDAAMMPRDPMRGSGELSGGCAVGGTRGSSTAVSSGDNQLVFGDLGKAPLELTQGDIDVAWNGAEFLEFFGLANIEEEEVFLLLQELGQLLVTERFGVLAAQEPGGGRDGKQDLAS